MVFTRCVGDESALRVPERAFRPTNKLHSYQRHGGLKQNVTNIQSQLKDYQFVCKTDVKQFYESIEQPLLMEQTFSKRMSKTISQEMTLFWVIT